MNLIEWPYYRAEFLAAQGFSPSFLKRFWSKVTVQTGCWIWIGSRYKAGYGQIFGCRDRGHNFYAHVASWIIHRGPVPDGMRILHRCDNPPCVNPEHLFCGTMLENQRDMVAKGRSASGERHGMHKLTRYQVSLIRTIYETGEKNQYELSDIFGVSQTQIGKIVRRKRWITVG